MASLPIGLDATPLFDGGRMGRDPVAESYVQLATKVAETVIQHLHANPVQFGHFLQVAERMKNSGTAAVATNPAQDRDQMARRINRVIRRLAMDVYEKDYAKAYYSEIQVPFKATLKVILSTWPVDRLREVEDRLEKRILEVRRNGR